MSWHTAKTHLLVVIWLLLHYTAICRGADYNFKLYDKALMFHHPEWHFYSKEWIWGLSSGRSPGPHQVGWNQMITSVPSNPTMLCFRFVFQVPEGSMRTGGTPLVLLWVCVGYRKPGMVQSFSSHALGTALQASSTNSSGTLFGKERTRR